MVKPTVSSRRQSSSLVWIFQTATPLLSKMFNSLVWRHCTSYAVALGARVAKRTRTCFTVAKIPSSRRKRKSA